MQRLAVELLATRPRGMFIAELAPTGHPALHPFAPVFQRLNLHGHSAVVRKIDGLIELNCPINERSGQCCCDDEFLTVESLFQFFFFSTRSHRERGIEFRSDHFFFSSAFPLPSRS